jgi:hypothetical protein
MCVGLLFVWLYRRIYLPDCYLDYRSIVVGKINSGDVWMVGLNSYLVKRIFDIRTFLADWQIAIIFLVNLLYRLFIHNLIFLTFTNHITVELVLLTLL